MKSKYLGWKITGSYIELITACVILRELGLMSLDNHISCDHYCITIYHTGYYGLTNAASAENASNSIEAKQFINEYNEYKNKIKNKQVMETRNVKVTLETAQRWYQQGGEFKEMALSAYTEAELNPIKNEWESKAIDHGNKFVSGWYLGDDYVYKETNEENTDRSTFKTEKQAKSALAYAQLTQLMALPEYNGDWVADWNNSHQDKYSIYRVRRIMEIWNYSAVYYPIHFKSREISERFLKNNIDLLKQYFEMD